MMEFCLNMFHPEKNISYDEALKEIDNNAKIWLNKIKIDTLIFKNIGEFYLNVENKICFQAYNTINFSHSFSDLKILIDYH